MKRGDLIIVAVPGDYGKPRPAVIILANVLIGNHPSIAFCQLTTTINDLADFRVRIEPSPANGLRKPSQIMADKPMTIRRDKVSPVIGRLGDPHIRRLNVALAFALGLSD